MANSFHLFILQARLEKTFNSIVAYTSTSFEPCPLATAKLPFVLVLSFLQGFVQI
jgi:hypothetical protein